jgi:hypothetical protein
VLILPKNFMGFHESIRLVLLSEQVWTKNVENSQSYLIEYISLENIENVIFKFNFLPKNFTAITDFETSCASASEF